MEELHYFEQKKKSKETGGKGGKKGNEQHCALILWLYENAFQQVACPEKQISASRDLWLTKPILQNNPSLS